MTGSGPSKSAVSAKIAEYLAANNIEFERPQPNTFIAGLPGEHRLKTNVSMIVGDYSVSVNAFIIRNPDENHAEV